MTVPGGCRSPRGRRALQKAPSTGRAAVHRLQEHLPYLGLAMNRRCVTDSTTPPPELRLRRDAVRSGWSDGELARLVRAGELERLRRGAYVNGVLPENAAALHRLLIRATVGGLRRSAVVSHQSAAVLHGLPLWDVALDRVHVT